MSSTITVSRRVGAFRTPTQVLYACFESTYKSNELPHKPVESCFAFGTASSCMAWILSAMHSCNVSFLRGPSKYLEPFDYYQTWKAAFAHPVTMFDRAITLDAGPLGNIQPTQCSWYERNQLQDVLDALSCDRYKQQAEILKAGGRVTLSLHQDGDVLAQILDDVRLGGRMAPFKLIKDLYGCGVDTALAAVALESESPIAFDLYDTSVRQGASPILVRDTGSGTAVVGPPETIMASFLHTEAGKLEQGAAGAGIGAAIALNNALSGSIPMLSESCKLGVEMERWAMHGAVTKREIVKYAKALGLDRSTTRLEATLGAWLKAGILLDTIDRSGMEPFSLVQPNEGSANRPDIGERVAA